MDYAARDRSPLNSIRFVSKACTRPSASSRRRSLPRIPTEGREVLNFCANNYLGLADHPDIIAAAKRPLDTHGFGLASVRFICGTQDLHKQLEAVIAKFFGTDDTILHELLRRERRPFETILNENDAVISDALNHASIIDGIRLCKAERRRYANGDMAELEKHLQETQGKRTRDGHNRRRVLDGRLYLQARRNRQAQGKIRRSADGRRFARDRLCRPDRARLGGIARRARQSGYFHFDARQGARRRLRRPTRRKEIIDLLRQRSRPYLFSNTLPPPLVAASIKVFEMLNASTALRDKVNDNARYFRKRMTAAGFDIKPGTHPIAPVMLHDAKLAQQFASELLDEGIYVIRFFFPVVPQGQARIRTQMSAPARTRRSIASSRRS
jgi:glycine C-acetyltransferase